LLQVSGKGLQAFHVGEDAILRIRGSQTNQRDVFLFDYVLQGRDESTFPQSVGDILQPGCLSPFDCGDQLIVDDDLRVILDDVPAGVRFTFISDSCHSGSVTRAVAVDTSKRRVRFASPSLMGRGFSIAVARREAKPRHRRSESSMNELLISGCLDSEYSYDDKFGRRYHGAMTYHALRSLEHARWTIRYEDWIADVNNRLAEDMYHQHPQLEGRSAAKRRMVFA